MHTYYVWTCTDVHLCIYIYIYSQYTYIYIYMYITLYWWVWKCVSTYHDCFSNKTVCCLWQIRWFRNHAFPRPATKNPSMEKHNHPRMHHYIWLTLHEFYTYDHIYICMYMYKCMWIYMYKIYIYIYIYICRYVNVHIHYMSMW